MAAENRGLALSNEMTFSLRYDEKKRGGVLFSGNSSNTFECILGNDEESKSKLTNKTTGRMLSRRIGILLSCLE